MSNPGRAEAAKPSKKKKKEGEAGLSKAIIGKLHIPKKGKKKDGSPGSPEPSDSPKTGSPVPRLRDESGRSSEDFLRTEASGSSTSTPIKEGTPKPDIDSPKAGPVSPIQENAKLIESEKPRPPEAPPSPEKSPEEVKPPERRRAPEVPKSPEEAKPPERRRAPEIPESPGKPKSPDRRTRSPESEKTEESKKPPKIVSVRENLEKSPIHSPKPEAGILKESDREADGDTSSMETATSPALEAQSGLKRECLYKILVIGELGTGKTSIIKRYVHQFFSQHYRATIGVDFALKVLNWDQNTIIRLQLWDIAGQERFGNMTRVYYKEAVGAFIVFDVTRAATFDAVVKWKQDLDAKVQLPDGSPIPCVLLANKCDQQKEGIVNNPNKMNEYCEEHKFTAWFETSAKENINIEEAAKTLVDQIVRNDSSSENGRNGARDLTKFPLESSEDITDGKSCAC